MDEIGVLEGGLDYRSPAVPEIGLKRLDGRNYAIRLDSKVRGYGNSACRGHVGCGGIRSILSLAYYTIPVPVPRGWAPSPSGNPGLRPGSPAPAALSVLLSGCQQSLQLVPSESAPILTCYLRLRVQLIVLSRKCVLGFFGGQYAKEYNDGSKAMFQFSISPNTGRLG